MNVIRINWPLVRRLTLFTLALYLVYLVIHIAFIPYDSTLHIDPEYPGSFFISREQAKSYALNTSDVDKNDPSKVRFRIKSVLIRYAKTPVEYWAPLIEDAIKLGVNTIQIQVVWNFHEPMFKHFDYIQKSHDLEMFIRLVDSYKLFVIVQVDPYYYCSDYDLGGVPSWLLGNVDLKIREDLGAGLLNLKDFKFMTAFKKYLDSMLWIIGQAQAVYGGPVIAMQVQYYEPEIMQGLGYENDLFKFYGPEYVELIQDKLYQFNIVELLLRTVSTCELNAGIVNGGLCDHDLKVYFPVVDSYSKRVNNLVYNTDQIIMFRYFYEATNCYDSNVKYWSVKSLSKNNIPNPLNQSPSEQAEEHKKHAYKYKATLDELDNSHSYSITNFYCHSNYGFHVAAHHNHLDPEQRSESLPISSSHLLGKCLIEENLQPGDKFWLSQQILASPKKKATNIFRIRERKNYRRTFEVDVSKETALPMSHYLTYQNLSGLLEAPLVWNKSYKLYFEFLSLQFPNLQHSQHVHPNSGFVLYRLEKLLVKDTVVRIDTREIKDYALVMCNLNEILMVVDTLNDARNEITELRLDKHCEYFDILVENMGRYSDASRSLHLSQQRKGITSKSAIQYKLPNKETFHKPSLDWNVFFLDFEEKFIYRISLNSHWRPVENRRLPASLLNMPVMTYTKFRVAKTANNKLNTVGHGASDGANQTGIYLLLPNTSWSKGAVFLNNFNLGRYWSVGPLCTIFIPEFMLYEGLNEVMIFELNKSSEDLTVYLTHSHVVL